MPSRPEPLGAWMTGLHDGPSMWPGRRFARISLPLVTVACAVGLAAASPQPVWRPQPADMAVATETRAATEAAIRTLKQGGSAADAAITAALMLGVVSPTSSGLGGGGFAMVWDSQAQRMAALDFRETAPAAIDPSELANRPVASSKRGVLVGVPGEVAGLMELHARWGRRSFFQNAREAIATAERGFAIEPHMARSLREYSRAVRISSSLDALFYRRGYALRAGAVVQRPLLARTLRRIATGGAAAFYTGPVAADVASTVRSAGGRMLAADLASYRVLEREPLLVEYRGHHVYTMPPPSAGGLLLAQTLRMHSPVELQKLDADSAQFVHVLALTFRGAHSDRVRTVGDPAFVSVPVQSLLSRRNLDARRQRVDASRTQAPQAVPFDEHGTSHLVVVDRQRNAVSLTTTVNSPFGARLVAPLSGVLLNDELDDFSTPEFDRTFGVPQPGPNAPRPGARPVSSMCPTIVMREGRFWAAIGGSGGMRIAPNVTQVLLRMLAFDQAPVQAVRAPRLAVSMTTRTLMVEPSWLSPAQLATLRSWGEQIKEDTFPAAVQVVQQAGNVLEAAADPRKYGHAVIASGP